MNEWLYGYMNEWLYECFSPITLFWESLVWDRSSLVGWGPAHTVGGQQVGMGNLCYPGFLSFIGNQEYLRESHFPWLLSIPDIRTVTPGSTSTTGFFSWAGVMEQGHPGINPLECPHSSSLLPSLAHSPLFSLWTSCWVLSLWLAWQESCHLSHSNFCLMTVDHFKHPLINL